MAATITTTLKDNSKEWADALKSQFAAAGISADAVGDKFEAVGKELDARKLTEYQQAVKRMADEVQNASADVQAFRAKAKADNAFVLVFDQVDAGAKRVIVSGGTATARVAALNKELSNRAASRFADEIKHAADKMEGLKTSGGLGAMLGGLGSLAGKLGPVAVAASAPTRVPCTPNLSGDVGAPSPQNTLGLR